MWVIELSMPSFTRMHMQTQGRQTRTFITAKSRLQNLTAHKMNKTPGTATDAGTKWTQLVQTK